MRACDDEIDNDIRSGRWSTIQLSLGTHHTLQDADVAPKTIERPKIYHKKYPSVRMSSAVGGIDKCSFVRLYILQQSTA